MKFNQHPIYDDMWLSELKAPGRRVHKYRILREAEEFRLDPEVPEYKVLRWSRVEYWGGQDLDHWDVIAETVDSFITAMEICGEYEEPEWHCDSCRDDTKIDCHDCEQFQDANKTDPNSNDYTGSRAGFPADGI